LRSSACISAVKILITPTIGSRRRSCSTRESPWRRALKRSGVPAGLILQIIATGRPQNVRTDVTFAGNLAYVSIFDAVQVIESARMTGLLMIKSDLHLGNVSFNEGKIVDAECNGHNGGDGVSRSHRYINSGTFEFSTSDHEFPVVISVVSNTNFSSRRPYRTGQ